MRVEQYTARARQTWDEFVDGAKNGSFLFLRDYMEYHADRFVDHSVMFFDERRLVAVMPANADRGALHSHAGLTFGGIVSDWRMGMDTMLALFEALLAHLRAERMTRLVYKRIPHIYHSLPADEDLYALFRHRALLAHRDVSSTIPMSERPRPTKGRRWSARRAAASGLQVRESNDFDRFMAIAKDQLQRRHSRVPTHTGEEIRELAARFPKRIRLFGAYRGDDLLGGVIMYESPRVAHVQYMTASDEGRKLAVVDCVLDVLLNRTYAEVPYFDFGISTEDHGRHLNAGLAAYKESFGARTIAYDTYELPVPS
ncbi:MAG TPA: GNAT family N-acetyltransferase [Vicinamibacterales bacterium]|nr:GNAT family N-acetyltransferase [Vicinamibacterales bacterium]